MEAVRGSTFQIEVTVYKVWTGDITTSQPADLTGADVRLLAKKSLSDSDANALITKNADITDAANGVCIVQFNASDTNSVSYPALWYETVAKLSDGTVIRGGRRQLVLNGNVVKELF